MRIGLWGFRDQSNTQLKRISATQGIMENPISNMDSARSKQSQGSSGDDDNTALDLCGEITGMLGELEEEEEEE